MNVAEIIQRKGSEVATVTPDDPVSAVVAILAEKGFGALVVSNDGSSIDGIVSERDIVRRLGSDGPAILDQPVGSVMTHDVRTCTSQDSVEWLMGMMTEHRIRHLPVQDNGALAGMISIGDVVKWRVTELEDEMGHLENYIKQGW
jgi:CBS domain-containing protein